MVTENKCMYFQFRRDIRVCKKLPVGKNVTFDLSIYTESKPDSISWHCHPLKVCSKSDCFELVKRFWGPWREVSSLTPRNLLLFIFIIYLFIIVSFSFNKK